MPTNQQPSSAGAQPSAGIKCPLVRSRSLRLPSSKSCGEASSSTSLTRHGSIRQTKSQSSSSNSKSQPFAVFRKPFIKPKPTCFTSKSTECLDKVTSRTSTVSASADDNKRQSSTSRSPTKQTDGHQTIKGVTFQNDNHPTPSDSPTSMHSDRSHQSQDASSSWSTPALAIHLKRLTEEHEKLQVEYARVRLQLLENATSHSTTHLRRDLQHLSHSDSHLSSIPENSPGNTPGNGNAANSSGRPQSQETLIQGYRSEILRLQDENRKVQRKYWEQVMNSESIEDELGGGSSQQIVDLIDKVDSKQREIVHLHSRVQDLENQLSETTLELHQCQDALQDYQHMLEDANCQKGKVEKQLKEMTSTLLDIRENVDFLQVERSTLAEALQEAEQNLTTTKDEMNRDKTLLKEITDRAYKLYNKVLTKNLKMQLLQAELDSVQGRARDMLLSQGAELTMTAVSLSQVSMIIHTILTTVSEFGGNMLELQKDILEEIMGDFDSEIDKDISPCENICNGTVQHILETEDDVSCEKALLQHLESLQLGTSTQKPIPDVAQADAVESPVHSSSSSSSDRPISFVQSIVRAIEQTSKTDSQPLKPSDNSKSTKEINVPKKNDENASGSSTSSSESYSSTKSDIPASKDSSSFNKMYKPIGMATAFRPATQSSREISVPKADDPCDEESNRVSISNQLNQINCMLNKLFKVIELTHTKFLSKLNILEEENDQLQKKLNEYKSKELELSKELSLKTDSLAKVTGRSSELLKNLKAAEKNNLEEKEELQSQLCELKEHNKCLEVVNAEQSRQLREEVQKLVDSAVGKPQSEFLSNAMAICDKLALKQEITKLNEIIVQKEQLLQSLAQKFARTKKVMEENLQKAESEVECLDSVIEKVFEALHSHPQLVDSSDVLKSIYSLVNSNSTSEDSKMISSDIVSV